MSGDLEPKINFLIIGAAKCATTWLQWALTDAPDVWMPAPELHFFSREYSRGLDWYRDQFSGRGDASILGEKSNSYLAQPEAAERIHAHLPDVRLIVQMRDPVARAYSDYCMLFRRGEVSSDIYKYLDPDRAAGQRFLADGLYAQHLKRFRKLFGQEAILPLLYEDMLSDPERHLARIAQFLGVHPPPPVPKTGRVKDRHTAIVPHRLARLVAPVRPVLDPFRDTAAIRFLRAAVAREVTHPPLPEDLEIAISQFYRDDIDDLERITGCDLAKWRTRTSRAGEAISAP
jgi:hypothetical protein